MKKHLLHIILIASIVFCASCKKNNTTDTTKLYLSGTVLLDGDYSFVENGDEVDIRVYGVSHPKAKSSDTGHRLGLYYKINGIMEGYDTLYNAKVNPLKDPVDVTVDLHYFEVLDTIGTFTLTIYVYPEDSDVYYSSSRSVSVTVVDAEKSIPELAFNPLLPYIVDDRSLIELPYNYTETDRTGKPLPSAWITRNMAYLESGRAYADAEDMSYLFGRYYTYDEALTACPKGWRLPSDSDWTALANSISGVEVYSPYLDFVGAARYFKQNVLFNGQSMWEFWPDAPADGTSGLTVIPCGYCNYLSDKDFQGYLSYACFWTSDENPDDSSQAFYRYMVSGDDDVKLGSADKASMAMSVRCVAE